MTPRLTLSVHVELTLEWKPGATVNEWASLEQSFFDMKEADRAFPEAARSAAALVADSLTRMTEKPFGSLFPAEV